MLAKAFGGVTMIKKLYKSNLLGVWDEIKDELEGLLTGGCTWVFNELEKANEAEDWLASDRLLKILRWLHTKEHI